MTVIRGFLKMCGGTTFAAFCGYQCLAYRQHKLKEENMDFDLTQLRKDTTRPSNVYYGLNWGYRADETIEKSLDTGDLLFFNYNCMNCFTPQELISCVA